MNLLKNVKVKIKLIVAFLVVAFFIGIVGGVGIVSLKNVGENAEKIYNENLRCVYILTDMKENLAEIKSDTIQLVYIKDSSKKVELEKHIQENKDENDTYISEFEKSPMSDVEKNVYDILKGYLNKEQILSENVINLVNAENFSEAEKQYLEIPKVSDTMFISLSKLIEKNLNDAELTNDNINYIYTTSKMTMIVLSIVGLIFAVLIGLILSNDINKPLQTIKLFGEKLANYDFSHEFNLKRGDEFGQTGAALFKAQNNIKELIKIIIENAQDTSASAEELSAIVEELSSKAINIDEAINTIANNMQEASAETEEVSASIQEVDSSINKLSQRAMEGSSNAIGGKERAIQVKNNSQEAIKETKKISVEKQNKMIKVIEDCKVVNNIKVMADTISSIAEETNLLALNAAIEAARAGDVGKGFAVVADEVRALAEQSADAVKNIRETIVKVQGAFKNSIETGNDILQFISKDVHTQFIEYEKTGNQYYDDSDFVSKMSGDIAAMSEEVTATIGHVREAVQNMAGTARKSGEQAETIKEGMNETTQALKQVALTAQSQSELAQKLNEIVQKFNI